MLNRRMRGGGGMYGAGRNTDHLHNTKHTSTSNICVIVTKCTLKLHYKRHMTPEMSLS